MTCADDISTWGRTRPRCWHHPRHVLTSSLNGTPSPMQQALEAKELVLTTGRPPSGPAHTLRSKGDRPRRRVAPLLPSQPRPRDLGLIPPPLLPAPSHPWVPHSQGKGPWLLVCPGSAVQGLWGTGLPLWLWDTGKLFLEELMYGQVINLLVPHPLAPVLSDFC